MTTSHLGVVDRSVVSQIVNFLHLIAFFKYVTPKLHVIYSTFYAAILPHAAKN